MTQLLATCLLLGGALHAFPVGQRQRTARNSNRLNRETGFRNGRAHRRTGYENAAVHSTEAQAMECSEGMLVCKDSATGHAYCCEGHVHPGEEFFTEHVEVEEVPQPKTPECNWDAEMVCYDEEKDVEYCCDRCNWDVDTLCFDETNSSEYCCRKEIECQWDVEEICWEGDYEYCCPRPLECDWSWEHICHGANGEQYCCPKCPENHHPAWDEEKQEEWCEMDCVHGNPDFFDAESGNRCERDTWYCNGWCEISCPENFDHHRQCWWDHTAMEEVCGDEFCLSHECPQGDFAIWSWDNTQGKSTAACVPGEPAELAESWEQGKDGKDKMCWEYSYWNEDEQKWYGYEETWVWDEAADKDVKMCRRFEDCPVGTMQLWGRHGARGCSGDYEPFTCINGARGGIQTEDGHWQDGCVHGYEAPSQPMGHNFQHHKDHDDEHDPEKKMMDCIMSHCEMVMDCAMEDACGKLLPKEDNHDYVVECMRYDQCFEVDLFRESVHCVAAHCLVPYIEWTQHSNECHDDCVHECLMDDSENNFETCMSDTTCMEYFKEDLEGNIHACLVSLREGDHCEAYPAAFRGTVEHYIQNCHA